MADISATSSSQILSDLSVQNKFQEEIGAKKQLGQEEFMALMTTQLQNQDPLAPMENGDFIAQLAQFGTVSGIGDLQTSFDNLTKAISASDATDAAALVGKSVLSPGEVGSLGEGYDLSGAIDIPEGITDIQVLVESIGGVAVDAFDMANQPAGMASFSWDGKLADGSKADAGRYVIKAYGTSAEGPQSLQTYVGSRVESVSMGGEGKEIVLNLAGLGAKPLSEVNQLGL